MALKRWTPEVFFFAELLCDPRTLTAKERHRLFEELMKN
jgi:hypothetical protein